MDRSWAYGSDQRLRKENQDTFGVFEFPDFLLIVVCDGMGGHVGGAQASALAVKTVHDTMRDLSERPVPSALLEAVERANKVIHDTARRNHRLMGMGTTIVAAAATKERLYYAHVGDSRLYHIRNGLVKQLTKDHTMVNLFVEAELLSPEDAATHPEAHVLSRSLGVERSVEVDLGEPVELKADDALMICSDGVHGVLTDWELQQLDWLSPGRAVKRIFDIIVSRGGDDNATSVVVTFAPSPDKMPVTSVPDPEARSAEVEKQLEAPAPEPDVLIAPPLLIEAENDDVLGSPLSTNFSALNAEPEPLPELPRALTPAPAPPVTRDIAPTPTDKSRKSPTPTPPPVGVKPTNWRNRVVILAMAIGAAAGAVVIAALVVLGNQGRAQTAQVVIEAGTENHGGNDVKPLPQPTAELLEVGPNGERHITPDGVNDPIAVESGEYWFQPTLPASPRRLPHRAQKYTQPPPGGQLQFEAVSAARNNDCKRSLDTVETSMKASVDHASLFSQAWYCFNSHHQAHIARSELKQPAEFSGLISDFEGTVTPPEGNKLPLWALPAGGGIEYRLERWPDDKLNLKKVMDDLEGAPTVADHLGKDVYLEAWAARSLSRVPEPTEQVEVWWARRLYVAHKAMNGPIGDLLRTHRPELVPQIETLLKEAQEPVDSEGQPVEVPAEVHRAIDAGKGTLDIQATAAPKPRPKPAPAPPPGPVEPEPLGVPTQHKVVPKPRPLDDGTKDGIPFKKPEER